MLHLYTASRGRIGAIAKGSRKPRSRFGGRLEPFFRLDLMLHQGRGDLATVTERAHGRGARQPACERPGAGGGCAGVRCGPAAAGFGGAEPGRVQPALPVPCAARRRGRGCDGRRGSAGRGRGGGPGDGARVQAEARPVGRVRARVDGVRAVWRGGGAARVLGRRWRSGVRCLRAGWLRDVGRGAPVPARRARRPLAQAPVATPGALRQAERAISSTLEHHAHVQLRAAA